MKNKLLLLLIGLSFWSYSQDIIISFQGTGASTTIDNVLIQNLSNGSSVEVQGNNSYNLTTSSITTNIDKLDKHVTNNIYSYPNPTNGKANVIFNLIKGENIHISISNVDGKIVAKKNILANAGSNILSFIPSQKGMFLINISGKEFNYNTKLISLNGSGKGVKIKLENSTKKEMIVNNKNTNSFSYTNGDTILLRATSGNYSRIITDIPTDSYDYSFDFIEATDIDGNNYPVVTIGTQTWMAEDLKVTHYPNGDAIPNISDYDEWNALETNKIDDAYCINDDPEQDISDYGFLYTWAAAIADDWEKDNSDNQGICPNGWHLPTDPEWATLIDELGGESVAGSKMKEIGSEHWQSPGDINEGTNSSGFSALPGGYRNYGNSYFYRMQESAYWWSATWYIHEAYGTSYLKVKPRNLDIEDPAIYNYDEYGNLGYSVRCIKN